MKDKELLKIPKQVHVTTFNLHDTVVHSNSPIYMRLAATQFLTQS